MKYKETIKKIGLRHYDEIHENCVIWTLPETLLNRKPYYKLVIKFEPSQVIVLTAMINDHGVISGEKKFDRSSDYTPEIAAFLKNSPFMKK